MKQWLNGISYECAFWSSIYQNKKQRDSLFRWSNYGRELSLHNFEAVKFLDTREDSGKNSPIVLDVGCGLSYCTGNLRHGKPIDLHYVDPLAPFFNKIIKRSTMKCPQIEFGMIEFLSAFYNHHDVALIMVQNALDHCVDPMKGIYEALDSLETGGILYLKHYPNEAVKENYRGFHQFNIDEESGNLIIWNRTEHRNITEELRTYATIKVSRYHQPEEVVAIVTKTAPLPQGIINDKADKALLCRRLIAAAEAFDSPSFAFQYHLQRIYFKLIQTLARFINRDTKEFIKRILRNYQKK
ncbi:MAG: class I SAM-dependent methyltransferase [Bacteroidaceae bacterium]|nr:class I SAM-dependent methyltransferase [Bacteroidaceae bacterium]